MGYRPRGRADEERGCRRYDCNSVLGRAAFERRAGRGLVPMMWVDDGTEDVDVASVVRETLAEFSPRSAALALLRLPRLLDLIRSAGLEPTDEISRALVAELRGLCAREIAAL